MLIQNMYYDESIGTFYITINKKQYEKSDTCCICLEKCDTPDGFALDCCTIKMHNACFCVLLANAHSNCPLCRTPIEKHNYLTQDMVDNAELFLEKQTKEFPDEIHFEKQLEQVRQLKKNEKFIFLIGKISSSLVLFVFYLIIFGIFYLEKLATKQ
jgi:hypothetical protein